MTTVVTKFGENKFEFHEFVYYAEAVRYYEHMKENHEAKIVNGSMTFAKKW